MCLYIVYIHIYTICKHIYVYIYIYTVKIIHLTTDTKNKSTPHSTHVVAARGGQRVQAHPEIRRTHCQPKHPEKWWTRDFATVTGFRWRASARFGDACGVDICRCHLAPRRCAAKIAVVVVAAAVVASEAEEAGCYFRWHCLCCSYNCDVVFVVADVDMAAVGTPAGDRVMNAHAIETCSPSRCYHCARPRCCCYWGSSQTTLVFFECTVVSG